MYETSDQELNQFDVPLIVAFLIMTVKHIKSHTKVNRYVTFVRIISVSPMTVAVNITPSFDGLPTVPRILSWMVSGLSEKFLVVI